MAVTLCARDLQSGDPGEGGGLAVGGGFDAQDRVEAMRVAFAVEIVQVVDPAVMLAGAVGQRHGVAIFGDQFQQALEVFPERGRAAGLEGQHIGPVVLLADAQDRATRQKRVAADAQGGLRKSAFQLRGQPGQGLQFAVLLDLLVILECRRLAGVVVPIGPGVFDELGAHR